MTVTTDKAGILSADKELKHFDSDATMLVLRMQAAGWTGYMTKTGHAFLRAPDGVSTASVSRDSLRGRSGKNAQAVFTRWQREQEQARAAAQERNAFGITAGELEYAQDEHGLPTVGDEPVPAALLAEMRRSAPLREWVMSYPNSREALANMTFMLPAMEGPLSWVAFDHSAIPPVLIAHGSECDVDAAWLQLQEQKPSLFGASQTDSSDGGQDMKVYHCGEEGCSRQFDTAGGLNLHRATKHAPKVTCPVEGCGKQVRGYGGLGGHMRSHNLAAPGAGLEQAVADSAAVVAPKPVNLVPNPGVAAAPATDALMVHLENLPEGGDAEAMVAAIRSIVAAPLVEEVRRLREERVGQLEQIAKLEHDNSELEARLSILREALAV